MTATEFLDGRVTLHGGDCLAILNTLPSASVDSVVTDPPYHLTSIVKRFGSPTATNKSTGALGRSSRGFMGKTWDGGDIAFRPELWAEVLRVLKPGGHLAAFSGTRTYNRMAVAIEDAGFEIRDQLAWTYGSGFPKSHDVAKAIDKAAGVERLVVGQETLTNDIRGGALLDAAHGTIRPALVRDVTVATSDEAKAWVGWGTALKPAWEPICLGRKPLDGTVAQNVLTHGVGALNVDACRTAFLEGDNTSSAASAGMGAGRTSANMSAPAFGKGLGGVVATPHELGRWPANILHDGEAGFGDEGRYFYSAKADADDRIGSKHPTVKPVDLMQWLVRLITPKGGLVLDCFAGTGTTGEAAWREGMRAVLIERETEYQTDIARRMELAAAGPATRRGAIGAHKSPGAAGPLFDLLSAAE